MKVELHPHTPRWQEAFARHRERIGRALAAFPASIDHIGSTSLGDIAAKPVIDILVGLDAGVALDAVVTPLCAAGYTYVGKFTAGMPYRRFFAELVALGATPLPTMLGPDDTLAFGRDYTSVAHIHVMARGSHHWTRHIAFRDYLRAHADVRAAYEALKLKIAEIDFDDPLDYNAHKEDFIAHHQALALAWYERVKANGAV